MKRVIVALALVLGLAAAAQAAHQAVQVEDVILLVREGLEDDTIIAFLETRELGFALGPDEILRLRDAGVSEEVIRYLLARTGGGYAPPRAYAPPAPTYYDPLYYGYGSGSYRPFPSAYLGLSIYPRLWFDNHHHYDQHRHYDSYGHFGAHYPQPGHHFDAAHTRTGHSRVPHSSSGVHVGVHSSGTYGGGHSSISRRPVPNVGHTSAHPTGRSAGHAGTGHGGHSGSHGGHHGGSHGGHH